MFKIHAITLTNFRSYKGTHRFEFPSAIGLYYLTGKNKLEPALGANGAGKSTFMDAITWVLYGRTTRGLKANEILSWHVDKGTQVIIELTVGGTRHTIKRAQKPNSLLLDGKPVDQKELETSIRLNYAAFTHSVMFPQFGQPFFSLSATEKLTLFSDFMRLDFWLTKSDEAAKLAKALEADLDKTRASISRAEGQLEVTEADIEDLKVKSANFEDERQQRVEELKATVVAIYKKHKKTEELVDAMSVERKNAKVEVVHAKTRLDVAENEREKVLLLVQAESKRKMKCVDTIKSLKNEIGKFNSIAGDTCPHCEQRIDERHVKRVVQGLADELDDEQAYLEKSEITLADLNMVLVKHKHAYESAANEVQDIENEIVTLTTKLAAKTAELNSINDRLDDLGDRISAEETAKNPYEATLAGKLEALHALTEAIKRHKANAEDIESELAGVNFWVKGFKRIRLFIIEQAFQTLELEVNNCLSQLGMTDWRVTFDVERENKSGGITKGFVVLIKGPSNKEPVRWENWSGGETQRLQLAGDLGLANQIMQQAGLRSEIEFFDEPSTHLSPEGMMDLADTLHERAISEGKCIWIVDHVAIANFGDFEGIITARKDENGSSISTK